MPRFLDEIARFLDGERPEARPALRFTAGALVGSCFALFTPILLGLWIFRGREVLLKRGGSVRVDLASLLYPLGAVISGALFVLLVSRARSRIVAALLGSLALLPWLVSIVVCINQGYAHWQMAHTVTTLLGAIGLGAPLGWLSHLQLAGPRRQPIKHTAV